MERGAKDFLGAGWKFPPSLDNRGRIALAQDEQDIAEAIRIILLTRKGERPMRPEFGSDLYRLQFAPVDSGVAGRAESYVRDALDFWEPRIELQEVRVTPDVLQKACLRIEILYRVTATNNERNLVFPFYLIPGEE